MPWLAVDLKIFNGKNGEEEFPIEYIYASEPRRNNTYWNGNDFIALPNGTIEKIIGKKLLWENDPIEI